LKPGNDSGNMKKLNIYNYFDYRDYLEEYYNLQKSLDKRFSHRTFLKKAGITGSVYLYRILKGERALSAKQIPNFNQALGHNPREGRYFRLLVLFQNEKKDLLKEEYLRELLSLRQSRQEFKLEDEKLKFYSKWYYAVIRELAVCLDFKDDFKTLANHVRPRIGPDQAEGAVKYLVNNGFIKKDAKGKYAHVDPIITTGPEVNSPIVLKYHKDNLLQCAEVLDFFNEKERDISSLTMSVSRKTYKTIKEEIKSFRKRLLTLATRDENPELACLVGFQLLPRSKVRQTGRTK